MTDRFGRAITVDGNVYRCGGMEVTAASLEDAVAAFDGMAPAGWAEPEPVPDLSPAQFAFLLAITGYEDVWAAVEAQAKANNRGLYALLRGSAARERFRFGETQAMIALFAPWLPPGTDLSPEALLPAWMQAAAF